MIVYATIFDLKYNILFNHGKVGPGKAVHSKERRILHLTMKAEQQ